MDADDEPALTYFLPNGIADDSPPKKSSHIKASFGPIGGRNTATASSQSIVASSGNASTVSAAHGSSKSRSDVDFSGLHARPRPTLDLSPFGSGGGSTLSPRPTNYLLSDLGGEIHTPRSSRDFGDSAGSTPSSSSPFGLAGPFGPAISDTKAIGGAGSIRSPTSMFNRGQEAAKSFSMPADSGNSAVFGASESQNLYRGGGMASYLSGADTFGSSSMRTWPSTATDASQPRRILQRPPGLVGPPGLSDSSTMQTRMPPRVAGSQFGPFLPSPSSEGTSDRTFSGGDDQYGPSLLSSLRLSTGVFGEDSLTDGRVSNPELAELNTHSLRVGEMDRMHVRQAVDSASTMWDTRAPTTSRRIDIQATAKAPRSPKKAREGRKKFEGRSDLRAKALEFSMDAINALTPGSPMRPRRSERGRKVTPPLGHDSPSSYDSNRNNNEQTRGKRRNHVAEKSATSSSSNADSRRRVQTNQSEDSGSVANPLSGLESRGSPTKVASREIGKSKRRDDAKSATRSTARRNPGRGNDKSAGSTRRQVYREKQVKEPVKELSLERSSASNSPQERGVESDSQNIVAKLTEPKETVTQEAKSSSATHKALDVGSVGSSITKDGSENTDEVTAKGPSVNDDAASGDDVDDTKNSDEDADSIPVADNVLRDTSAVDRTSPKRESFSSSDAIEDAVEELKEERREIKADAPESSLESSESDAEQAQVANNQQRAASKKKSKKAALAPAMSQPGSSQFRREPSQVEKKPTAKEQRKEKPKKDKADKKKTRGKKDKRGPSLISKPSDVSNDIATEAQDKLLEAFATKSTPLSTRISQGLREGGAAAASAALAAYLGTRRGCAWVAGQLNVKGLLATTVSYVESVLAVVFSVVLLLSLHAASWFIRIHRVAFRAILTHRHIGFCFAFLYGFPFLVQYVFPWAPPWAPVCLWYAFLVQLFCTNGPTAMVTTFRVILPLVFLVEGISHHSFLLDLNGAELLLASFIISAVKTSNLCSPIFFLSLATQCLLAVSLGSELLVQWLQLALALYSLHVMAVTEDEWIGMGEEEDEMSCHPVSMHHSIADYNHHPAPSSAVSIQKTKRLDRRALAYVRGRKLR
ncbi:hypothetical protein GN244_ATG01550 [Phytophthora infestans]|uniref:Transmembrane protein n=1 Tax=Phytophthora infestans TaxID=4787 RepID=A0A833SD03_PHYIN|nr:hypothetical protein GN244_ATG01550 [Phytophthora infestans]KAF4129998.1 hypothetical protein GN958_ATG20809 [Phytophthora infestans]